MFFELQKAWGGIPFVVVNDGEVTALAGSMALEDGAVLGVSMGTSQAGGYVTPQGNITAWLNELAFVPIDYRPAGPLDEWSRDHGVGAQYFSQQAVNRLLPAAGVELPKEMPLAEKLVETQRLMAAGDTLARVQKAQARLELKLGRPATLVELGIEVEMPEDKLVEALRFRAEPLSLSEPLREDGDAELGDVVEDRSAESPFEVAAVSLLPEEIGRLLSPLDEREREILRLRFGLDRGEPRTLEEVGEHFNLTRERIRQIEARAMSKLRHPSSDTGARDLLTV